MTIARLRLPPLPDCSHRKTTGAREPELITGQREQFQKGIAVSACAMTEIAPLRQRPRLPDAFPAVAQERAKFRRKCARIGTGDNDTRRAVTNLDQPRFHRTKSIGAPIHAPYGANRIAGQRTCERVTSCRALDFVQPLPS